MMETTPACRRFIAALSLVLLPAWFAAFMPDTAGATPREPRPEPRSFGEKETWTFAFYLAGDNSLENEQVKNLQEICRGSESLPGVRMVVFFDRDDDVSADNLSTTWRGTRVMTVRGSYRETLRHPLVIDIPGSVDAGRFRNAILKAIRDPVKRDLVQRSYKRCGHGYCLKRLNPDERERIRDILTREAGYLLPLEGKAYRNLDAADPSTLRRFMNLVKDAFPADRYLLCITGHSSGWAARETVRRVPVKRRAREFSRQFTVEALKQALRGSPVDVLVLDTCSMAEVETAWALRDCAGYLVANQTKVPAMGLDYGRLLRRLGRPGEKTPRGVAFEAVEACRESYAGSPYALSTAAIDLHGAFRAFVPAFQRHAARPSSRASLKRSAERAWRTRDAGSREQGMLDLHALLSSTGNSALNAMAAGEAFYVNHVAINCSLSGMSIFLPRSRAVYGRLRDRYRETDFAGDFPRGWVKALPGIVPEEAR